MCEIRTSEGGKVPRECEDWEGKKRGGKVGSCVECVDSPSAAFDIALSLEYRRSLSRSPQYWSSYSGYLREIGASFLLFSIAFPLLRFGTPSHPLLRLSPLGRCRTRPRAERRNGEELQGVCRGIEGVREAEGKEGGGGGTSGDGGERGIPSSSLSTLDETLMTNEQNLRSLFDGLSSLSSSLSSSSAASSAALDSQLSSLAHNLDALSSLVTTVEGGLTALVKVVRREMDELGAVTKSGLKDVLVQVSSFASLLSRSTLTSWRAAPDGSGSDGSIAQRRFFFLPRNCRFEAGGAD